MSTIIQRIIGGSADNAIVMSNSCWAREISIPSTWTTIQLGLRWHWRDTGLNLVSLARLYIGVGHGTTNIIGDYSVDNWIGLISNAATWTRNVGYYSGGQPFYGCTKVGTTRTLSAAVISSSGSTSVSNGAATATADRCVEIVRITKGAPNFTIDNFEHNGATFVDVSEASFLTTLEMAVPILANHQDGNAQTLAFSEAAGTLNAIQIAWERSQPVIEICDVALAITV